MGAAKTSRDKEHQRRESNQSFPSSLRPTDAKRDTPAHGPSAHLAPRLHAEDVSIPAAVSSPPLTPPRPGSGAWALVWEALSPPLLGLPGPEGATERPRSPRPGVWATGPSPPLPSGTKTRPSPFFLPSAGSLGGRGAAGAAERRPPPQPPSSARLPLLRTR